MRRDKNILAASIMINTSSKNIDSSVTAFGNLDQMWDHSTLITNNLFAPSSDTNTSYQRLKQSSIIRHKFKK